MNTAILNTLPVGHLEPIYLNDKNGYKQITNLNAVVANGKVLATVTDKYEIVQHKDAFLKVAKEMDIPDNAKITVAHRKGKAWMNVYFDDLRLTDKKLGIALGFTIRNSIDKTMALGLQMTSISKVYAEKHIVFCAIRQVCSNGMTIKVPLSKLSEAEIDALTPDKVVADVQGKILASHTEQFNGSVRHFKGALNIKYVNVLTLAKRAVPYIQMIINKSMEEKMSPEVFALWLKDNGFKKGVITEIFKYYEMEQMGNTTWQAYNAITAYASHHKLKDSVREKITDKAWDIMPMR